MIKCLCLEHYNIINNYKSNKMKQGDKVRLKSGGPVMTVKQYPYKIVAGAPVESKAECEWFDKEDQLHHSTFELDVLEEVQA